MSEVKPDIAGWEKHVAPGWEARVAVAVIVTLIALAVLVFFVFPPLIVSSHDVPNVGNRLKLQNDVRTTGLQLLAGVALALGALFTARTITVNREGQITDRFTRAIDQLGSDKLEVRLGGIYALERISRDSHRDRWTITSILAAFVREHASAGAEKEHEQHAPPADVQAVVNVIGRIGTTVGIDVDLSDANLRGANLRYAYFVLADFSRSNLDWAVLTGANLHQAKLSSASLQHASLERANLKEASLDGTDLQYVPLLHMADLYGAFYDEFTRWPDGFNPDEWGARRI
jgi:hypothetical protein